MSKSSVPRNGARTARYLLSAHGSSNCRPRVGSLVPAFEQALDRRGWVSARTLALLLNVDARSLREAAHQSGGRILGGQNGYVLTSQATLEEVHAVTRRLLSQSNQMRARAMEIERVRHAARADQGVA